MHQTLLTSIENNVLTITLNRPEKLNALNKNVFTDLDKALDDVEKNPEIRSVIITGAGSKAFVAGADISELSESGGSAGRTRCSDRCGEGVVIPPGQRVTPDSSKARRSGGGSW